MTSKWKEGNPYVLLYVFAFAAMISDDPFLMANIKAPSRIRLNPMHSLRIRGDTAIVITISPSNSFAFIVYLVSNSRSLKAGFSLSFFAYDKLWRSIKFFERESVPHPDAPKNLNSWIVSKSRT